MNIRPGTARDVTTAEGPRLGWPKGLLWGIALGPALLWIAAVWYAHLSPDAFIRLTKEDGWVENGQVTLFVLAAVLAGMNARMLCRLAHQRWAWVYSLAAFGLIGVSGEEVSWGQRAFGWHTPTWVAAHNLQGETTIHNLVGVSWLTSRLMYAGALGMVLLALASRSRWLRRRGLHSALWIPHPVLIPVWLCYLAGNSEWVERLTLGWYPQAQWELVTRGLQEIRELVLAFGVAGFFMMTFSLLRRRFVDPPS